MVPQYFGWLYPNIPNQPIDFEAVWAHQVHHRWALGVWILAGETVKNGGYPVTLVNIEKNKETHNFSWENSLSMAIFNSYIKLPEDTNSSLLTHDSDQWLDFLGASCVMLQASATLSALDWCAELWIHHVPQTFIVVGYSNRNWYPVKIYPTSPHLLHATVGGAIASNCMICVIL